MISLLLLIPVLCISFSLYVMGLISFITTNSLDIILMSVTAFINIIISFFVIKIFISNNEHIAFIMNLDQKSSLIHGYFSFFIMLLFGISLIINSFLFEFNVANITIGTLILLLFIYVTYEHILRSDKCVLKLIDIDDFEEHLNRLIFEYNDDEIEYYVNKNANFKKDKSYLCKVGKSSKLINKIIKEVIELD